MVFCLTSTENCSTFQVTVRVHQQVQLRIVYTLEPPAGSPLPSLDLAIGYIPQESLAVAICIVDNQVITMPGTAKDLALPLTGLITIKVSGPDVTYTTHGVGGGSVTINIREVLDASFREMLGPDHNMLATVTAEAQRAFNSPLLLIALRPDPEAYLEIAEVHRDHLTSETPWDLDISDTPRWAWGQGMYELNDQAPEIHDEDMTYDSDPGPPDVQRHDPGFLSDPGNFPGFLSD